MPTTAFPHSEAAVEKNRLHFSNLSLIFWLVLCFNHFFFVFLRDSFIYLLVGSLGLCCCLGFSLAVESGACALAAVHGLLIAVASLVWGTGSRVHGVW